jgi:MFS family permease
VSGYRSLLRSNPDFSRLWMAQVVSLLGDWFNTIALSALVAEYTGGSGIAISGLLIARFLPPMIVSPFAGVLVDRFNRKRLLILSDLLRAGIVLLLLFANGRDQLWLIYLITIFQFSLSAVFEPGRSAIMPSLLQTPDDLVRANTLSNVTWSAMLAVGSIIGGGVAAAFGTQVALIVDSITFGISALLISTIKTKQEPRTQKVAMPGDAPQPSGSFMEGLRYVAQHPSVAAALFVKIGLSVGSADALMIAFGTVLFVVGENGTGSLGILGSAFGLGAIIGPFILNKFNDGSVKTMRRLMIISFAWVTAGWLLLGIVPALRLDLVPSMIFASLALIVRAMGGSATWTYSSIIIQAEVEDAYLGRIFSLDWMGYYLALTVSTLLTGVALESIGSENVGTITLGTGVLSLIPLGIWIWLVSWLSKPKPVTVPAAD